jgi:hypothetical protein
MILSRNLVALDSWLWVEWWSWLVKKVQEWVDWSTNKIIKILDIDSILGNNVIDSIILEKLNSIFKWLIIETTSILSKKEVISFFRESYNKMTTWTMMHKRTFLCHVYNNIMKTDIWYNDFAWNEYDLIAIKLEKEIEELLIWLQKIVE